MYCLNDRAWVDMGFMAALTGKTQDALEQELTGQIFRLPAADTEVPAFVLAEEYLSGNVRQRLAEARAAVAENPIYAANVTALEQVQPQDLSAAEISALSREIAAARREVSLCSDIQQRSVEMTEKLKNIHREEQHRKEELQYGHQRTGR